MKARAAFISKIDIDYMFPNFSALKDSRKFQNIEQVRYLLFSQQHIFTSDTAVKNPPRSLSSSSKDQKKETDIDLSSANFTGIAKSVLLNSSYLLEIRKEKACADASLKDHLVNISDVFPRTARKFLRFLVLKPENVLEILVVFWFECEKVGFRAEKVETLWQIFKWGGEQHKHFRHLPRSYEVMALMLIRVGMFREVELLLSATERERMLLNNNQIISTLIEGYIAVGDLERAVLVFDGMRKRGLVPSLSCFCVFIDHLVKLKRVQLALRVCTDMVVMGNNLTDLEKASFESVIRLLCRYGKIQEARNLVRKAMAFGLKPGLLVLNDIACGYCEKKDFEDLLSFFVEIKCAPEVLAGNRIVHSLCSVFGVRKADLFRQELEHLGFWADEITFGILIGWSCLEGKLRNAFFFLSEILSRGLNPDIHSYNALIGGMFKEGMSNLAKDIIDEMVSRGTPPTLSTYRTLLAGYCKARKFDEAKIRVSKMAESGFIELSSQEDPLSKAFMALGINPLAIRLRRDNDMGFSKAEFFDDLGNGLYLDTELDDYDKKVTEILEDSMIPNFNCLIKMELARGNLKDALLLVNEMVRWGQKLSLPVFAPLVKGLCLSPYHIKACTGLLEKMPKLADHLNQESLNMITQACCKKGLVRDAKRLFDGMLRRDLIIENETYTALLIGLCKKGIMKDFHGCWETAQKKNWLPGLEASKVLIECLCHKKLQRELLELLERMLVFCPDIRLGIFHVFLEKMCVMELSTSAHALVEELVKRGCELDQIAYSHLVGGLCKEKRFSAAFKMLDTMLAKNMPPSLDVSVALIPQLFRADRLEKAVALKEISLKEQPLVSSSLRGAFIKGYCLTGKVGEASKLCREMLSEGMLLEGEIYDMLIQGHCLIKNWRKVWELLSAIIRKRLSLSISSYRNLVRWMCTEGRVPWALSLTQLMLGQSKCHNLIIINILVFHLMSSVNNFPVNRVLDELQKNGLLLDQVTYNFLVYGFSKRKDVSSSVQYLTAMLSKGFTPNNRSLRSVVSCLCEVGELGKALDLSQEMRLKDRVHDSIVQNAIAEGLLSHGKLEEAEHFLDQIIGKDLVPDAINYDNLIKQFCGYGRLNKAVDLLNVMLKKGSTPSSASYDSLIHGYCTCNKLDQAMDMHEEMLSRDLRPSMNTWHMLIHRLCQEGRTPEAEKLLTSLVELGQTPTQEMYSAVVNSYSVENNLRKVSALMQGMQQSGYSPDFNTHWSLISNLGNSNDKDGDKNSKGFLSRLLSGSGFSWRKG